MKTAVDTARDDGQRALPPDTVVAFEQRYEEALKAGYQRHPRPPPPPPVSGGKKRGRPAQPPPLNLLDRLRDFKTETLAFLHDFRVPFDNTRLFAQTVGQPADTDTVIRKERRRPNGRRLYVKR
jgi:hypothetical protein